MGNEPNRGQLSGFEGLRKMPIKMGSNNQLNYPLHLFKTLDNLVDPFLVLDNLGRLLYYNRAAKPLFGNSIPEMLGKNPRDFFFQLSPQFIQKFQQAVHNQIPVHFEVKHQGTWYGVHYYPSGDQLLVQFHDISKSKHLEFELQYSLHRFKASLDNMLDSFVILSSIRNDFYVVEDFNIEFINQAACSKLQRTPKDIIGRTLFEVYPGHRNSLLFSKYVNVVETGKPLFLESNFYENTLFSGFFDVQIVKMGDGIAVSWRNVTQRQLAEEALRSSEERFYKAFHLNPATMSISKVSDGTYIDVNRRWIEATGYTAAEVIGNSSTGIDLWTAGDFCHEFRKVFSTNGEIHGMEAQVRTKSGRILTGLLSSEVINMNGEPCWLTVFQDTTEKRLLEEHLARLDRLHLIGETAASIGHEIRNPLTSVRGFLQLIGESDEGAQFKDYFTIILEELDRANFILSEFLLLAKDKAIDPSPRDLNAIIKAIQPLLQADASHSEKTVELQLEPVPVVNLDDKEIRQLVINLARNGLEAMEPGGNLIIATHFKENEVILAVQDTGSGIKPELREKLGTPFVTSKDGGTGLGLAVCYSIAARHHAMLSFDTSPQGTTFQVRFRPASRKLWEKSVE